jgi:hypothetical protein
MLAPNKASISPSKSNGVLPWAKKHFWTTIDIGISNQTIHSKLRTTERVYRWWGVEKENISLNT